ncbi:uncharacterized protein LOC125717772 isoform X9 [Brienomyrus brachyistius]|uniref:uncharacterized protein LOC125717772 isoform X9 n=1 Tax=Brienomyrus brachyistius TaxID=42636 RepID=UPI0020B3FA07|nr:uncharacterized protein LOC125717772 isoform X9 [Brienomyrus brachyistius]
MTDPNKREKQMRRRKLEEPTVSLGACALGKGLYWRVMDEPAAQGSPEEDQLAKQLQHDFATFSPTSPPGNLERMAEDLRTLIQVRRAPAPATKSEQPPPLPPADPEQPPSLPPAQPEQPPPLPPVQPEQPPSSPAAPEQALPPPAAPEQALPPPAAPEQALPPPAAPEQALPPPAAPAPMPEALPVPAAPAPTPEALPPPQMTVPPGALVPGPTPVPDPAPVFPALVPEEVPDSPTTAPPSLEVEELEWDPSGTFLVTPLPSPQRDRPQPRAPMSVSKKGRGHRRRAGVPPALPPGSPSLLARPPLPALGLGQRLRVLALQVGCCLRVPLRGLVGLPRSLL